MGRCTQGIVQRQNLHYSLKTALGEIETKNTWKHLGVTYDSTLSFNQHISKQTLHLYQLLHQMRKYALFSLKISNNHFTRILSQAILPKPFYNAAIWRHKAKLKANLQKNCTLINSPARIATNLPRTTPLQIIYQLTNIPSTKILLEREIVLHIKRHTISFDYTPF